MRKVKRFTIFILAIVMILNISIDKENVHFTLGNTVEAAPSWTNLISTGYVEGGYQKGYWVTVTCSYNSSGASLSVSSPLGSSTQNYTFTESDDYRFQIYEQDFNWGTGKWAGVTAHDASITFNPKTEAGGTFIRTIYNSTSAGSQYRFSVALMQDSSPTVPELNAGEVMVANRTLLMKNQYFCGSWQDSYHSETGTRITYLLTQQGNLLKLIKYTKPSDGTETTTEEIICDTSLYSSLRLIGDRPGTKLSKVLPSSCGGYIYGMSISGYVQNRTTQWAYEAGTQEIDLLVNKSGQSFQVSDRSHYNDHAGLGDNFILDGSFRIRVIGKLKNTSPTLTQTSPTQNGTLQSRQVHEKGAV